MKKRSAPASHALPSSSTRRSSAACCRRPRRQRRLAAVNGTLDWNGFDLADVVVEAAVEKLDAKRAIFRPAGQAQRNRRRSCRRTPRRCRSPRWQEGLQHPGPRGGAALLQSGPQDAAGRGGARSADRRRDRGKCCGSGASRWARRRWWCATVPGFVVNRVLMPYLNEAVLLVGEGLKIDEIDRVMQPLRHADGSAGAARPDRPRRGGPRRRRRCSRCLPAASSRPTPSR